MNSRRRLSENRHEQSIGSIYARQLHVIDELIRRNSFENKLARIGVLTFVPFQGNRQKTDPHEHDKQKDQTQANPGPPSALRWNTARGKVNSRFRKPRSKPAGFVTLLFSAHRAAHYSNKW